MKKNIDTTPKKEELSLFEETLADYIEDYMANGKSPFADLARFKREAEDLLSIALDPIPCWKKITHAPLLFNRGLHETPIGQVLVRDGYFVLVQELAERLPRTFDE